MDYSKLWRISVYFAFAIQCLSYSQGQGGNECSPRCWHPVQNNSGIYGGIEQVGVVSVEDCKALCVNTESCIGIDWIDNGCWLQTTEADIYKRPGLNHWSLANCTDDCAPYCWKPVQNGVQVPGGEVQPDIRDESKCKFLCSNTPNCTGIDWGTLWCHLIFTKNLTSGQTGVNHWDIERNLATNCLATAVTTAAATTSMKMTTASTHVTTRPTARLETTTNIQTEETSMSEVPNISSGTFPTVSTTPPPVTSILNTDAIIGGVVGGICGLILVIILLIVIIRLARKRQRKEKEKLKEIDDDILMEPDHKKNGSRPAVPPKPELTSTLKPSTDPVSLAKLSSHFASLNSVEKLKREFDSLPLANYDACSAAKNSDNSTKRDRFKNILPYDATRVKLLVQKSGTSDYVNASYIEGYDGSQKVYIAAQGPMKTTLSDFWQMIWNEGLNRIVMITQLTEQGKSKCEKYWPDDINSSKEFNEVTVILVERHICTDYVKRVMRVEHKVNLILSYMNICKALLQEDIQRPLGVTGP